MSNGYSGTIKMLLDDYAEVFLKAGIASIVYDNRNSGSSDTGPAEVRYDFDPIMQARDHSHAITFAESLSEVDSKRIGLWGTSYSGLTAILAAANDARVKCVVSQVPCISGHDSFLQLVPVGQLDNLLNLFYEDRRQTMAGKQPMTMKICTDDPNEVAAFPGTDTYWFFQKMNKERDAGWENITTVRSLEYFWWTDVYGYMERISPTALLIIAAKEDVTTPTDIICKAYSMAREPKKLVFIPGRHYNSYTDNFEDTSSAARDWFKEHL
jgi:predicted acyl esterase